MSEHATAYPLAWPPGFPRTKRPGKSQFRVTLNGALNGVHDELRRLGAKHIVLSSNVTLGNHRPEDTGVACYFVRAGRQLCIPCDAWDKVEDNLRAIEKTINAQRGIERWGGKHLVDAAFDGYVALPPPGRSLEDATWRRVLGVDDGADLGTVERAYRKLAIAHHPDQGGDPDQMARINAAIVVARKELGSHG
jgi:hypothetical protein